MPIDFTHHAPSDFVIPLMDQMRGSQILKIAGQVRSLTAQGRQICNLTIGDFKPAEFPIPTDIAEGVSRAYAAGQTNYPPADGTPELKGAISAMYQRQFGLDYGPDSVCVGSGARPPIYASWRLFVAPGDKTVSFLPAWNVGYYAHLLQSNHHFIQTQPENNFHPTVEQVSSVLPDVQLIALNTPSNPTGTVIDKEVLAGIAQAIVDENKRRRGRRPVMLLFDQVYWMLTEPGYRHWSPVQLVPECAPYVIHVDAISKCFAATGLRVGWAVLPPFLQKKMKALIGHMGAWAARPEQLATAWLLNDPSRVEAYMTSMQASVSSRLQCLYTGIKAMNAKGLPVDAISPQGAIYLSFKVDLPALGFDSNEAVRNWLLESAGLAVVPFQAFDLPDESGWFRMSVGAATLVELEEALERIETLLQTR